MIWTDLQDDLAEVDKTRERWFAEYPNSQLPREDTRLEALARRVLSLYQPCPEGQGINGSTIKPADGLTVNQHNGAYLLARFLFGKE